MGEGVEPSGAPRPWICEFHKTGVKSLGGSTFVSCDGVKAEKPSAITK